MEKLQNLSMGVDRLFIENQRFNTTLISVNFYMPLTKRGVAVYSLLTSLMASACKQYPDFSALSLKQKELYAAQTSATVDKVGDLLLVKFYASYLNNDVLEQDIETECNNLLLELLFNPLVENKAFLNSEILRERRLILEKIKSLKNEKRAYSISQTISKMYEGTAYAVNKLGDINDLEEITGEELYNAYIAMLENAYIRLQVTAKDYNGNFDNAFKEKIAPFRKNKDYSLQKNTAKKFSAVTTVSEKAQINQAKLCMAFTCEDVDDSAALNIFSDIFGGGPYSYLFSNVREKLSLCYYCAARVRKNKGLLIVDSGVDANNIEKAKEQILIEKAKIEKGEFTDELIATSKKSMLEALKANNDSDLVLDVWYSLKPRSIKSVEDMAEEIVAVNKQEIIDVAKKFKLDTVFMLVPEEN